MGTCKRKLSLPGLRGKKMGVLQFQFNNYMLILLCNNVTTQIKTKWRVKTFTYHVVDGSTYVTVCQSLYLDASNIDALQYSSHISGGKQSSRSRCHVIP